MVNGSPAIHSKLYHSKLELEKTDTSVHIADWIFSVAASEKKKKSPTVLALPK